MSGEGKRMEKNAKLSWFRRIMWLGIVSNVVVAVVSIADTPAVLAFLHLPLAQPLIWPRFAALLLILLSGFYVAAALDPVVNRYSAWFAIVCRLCGVIFFSIIGGGYIVFGLFDFVFCLPQAILLTWGLHQVTPKHQTFRASL